MIENFIKNKSDKYEKKQREAENRKQKWKGGNLRTNERKIEIMKEGKNKQKCI